jgi:predicted phage tail protein
MRGIFGAKDTGSTGGSPTEASDSLHSDAQAQILDLISEGEILGLVNGNQSIFFDGTPLANADGTLNYTNVAVDVRTGTQDQTYIPGFPSSSNEVAIGVELRADTPWTHAIQNLQLSAVSVTLSVDQLEQTNTTTGDVTGYLVAYLVELSTDGAAFQSIISTSFNGKTTSKYERTHRVDLPGAAIGWTLRVTRTTPNTDSAFIADTTTVESYAEIIDAKLSYPMSALVGLQFDAMQFSSIPTRSYDMYGRILQVPTSYDPTTRTYAGTWDGTFKPAYSNNPAWVFYDLVLNNRYGCGDVVNAGQVDRFELYRVAQYCDVLVSDGKGGTEPRFTCNAYLQSRADAFQVLQSIASIFRGMAYWATGSVVVTADMPLDTAYVYTAANVIGGQFTYAGSPLSTRYTVALVSWNDPTNGYQQAVEYVEDSDGIARYGVVQTELTAFGCTSQGQAQRCGQWALLTSRLETDTVTFQVGLDGTLALPGQIIGIADPARAGRRNGGRIRTASGKTVVIDKETTVAAGDTLTAILPTGLAEKQTIASVDGAVITVTDFFSVQPESQAIWLVESPDLLASLWRVATVSEQSDAGSIAYEITATQYDPSKYDAIDNGTAIDTRPITVIPPSVQPPPTNVRMTTYNVTDQGMVKTVMTIAWDSAPNAVAYLPEWQKDGGDWVPTARTGSLGVDVASIYQGVYLARVRSVNALNVQSTPAYSVETTLHGKTSPPPALTSLTATSKVFGIGLQWGFPVGASDTQRTEIWRSAANDLTTATKLSDLAYPQADYDIDGLSAGASFFFWGRLVDTSGNVGPWYPADPNAGVNGQSSSDATAILQYLAGQISETQLAQTLITQIEAGGDAAVAVQQLTSALAAMYTIKAQLTSNGRTAMAGIGVGVENDDGVLESQVLVLADRFAVINEAGDTLQSPFVIQGGQVFINQALIGTAWITNANIADTIESTTVNDLGQPSWIISKAGGITLNGPPGFGWQRLMLSGSTLQVFDSNNVLRVKLGLL